MNTRSAHSRVVQRLFRSPEVKGELSRFKLGNKYRRSHHIYIWRPGAWTKQCSWRKDQDGYKRKGGSCDRKGESCVKNYAGKEMTSVRRDKREARPCAA